MIHPEFAAMVFIGQPRYGEKKPIFLINEESVFDWFDAMLYQDRRQSQIKNFIPQVLTKPEMFKTYFKTISMEDVHDLKIRSTGTSSYMCSKHSHDTKSWQDPNLPISISTCQLGQISKACEFALEKPTGVEEY
jgi:hypothetical protein